MSILPQTLPTPIQQSVDLQKLPPDTTLAGPAPDSAFVKSIGDFGVLQAIVLTITASGLYKVEAGRRRIKAARLVGLPSIPALIFPDHCFVEGAVTLVENQQRKRNPAADVQAVNDLLKSGASQKEIARELGIPQITLKSILRLSALHPDILSGLAEGTVKEGVAESVAKLSPPKQKELADTLNREGKLRHEDVSAVNRTAPVILPGELFATPAFADPPVAVEKVVADVPSSWREKIRAILTAEIPVAPPQDWSVLTAIQELLDK